MSSLQLQKLFIQLYWLWLLHDYNLPQWYYYTKNYHNSNADAVAGFPSLKTLTELCCRELISKYWLAELNICPDLALLVKTELQLCQILFLTSECFLWLKRSLWEHSIFLVTFFSSLIFEFKHDVWSFTQIWKLKMCLSEVNIFPKW